MNKIIVTIIFLIIPILTYGSHAMGGELTYRYLGNQDYEITYTFYRDCSGIAAPGTVLINIVPQTGTGTSVTVPPTANSPLTIHTTCPTELTTCNGGFNKGVQKWIYCDTIQLTTGIFTISHSENARNSALTTITGAGGDNLFVYAVINNTGQANNSPVFNVNPVISLCQGQSYCIPSFVSDKDGDSLAFEFITPRTGPLPSDTVTYFSPYSATQPLTSSPAMTLDNANGEICVNPTATEVSPVAVLVSEFRNGVLLGQVERDMQIQIEVCNNQLPFLTGFNGAPSQTLNVCATLPNCFFITGVDNDTTNSTFVSWDVTLQGATTIHSLGKRDTLYLCWTPTDSDTITTRCFTAMISDDNCPYPATVYKEYCLTVTPSRICNPQSNVSEHNKAFDFSVHVDNTMHKIIFDLYEPNPHRSLMLCNSLGISVKKISAIDKNTMMDITGLSPGIYIVALIEGSNKIISTQKILIVY